MSYASVVILPARLSRLPGMALIIIASAATTAAFTTTAATAAGTSAAATTAKSAPAAAATAEASSTTAAAGTIRLRFRLINLQRASLEFGSVQGRDGLFGFAGVSHFHERKSAGAAGFAVGDHTDFLDGSVGLEKAA
jgi:hypothetical protein